MRIRLKPSVFLPLIAALISLVLFCIHRVQTRFVRTDADLVALLPRRDLTTFFVNVELLRRSNLLRLLSAPKASEESDYRRFVRETGFDYSRDIDVLAGESDDEQWFLLLRGRFDWGKLRSYASAHGGSCGGDVCKLPASRPGRWISFMQLQPNVLGVAINASPLAVQALAARKIDHPPPLPTQPVWVRVAHYLLSDPKSLPLPVQIFVMALESADEVTLSADLDPENRNQFQLRMEAQCRNGAIADTARKQLEIQTKMLALGLERQHQQPNPADLSGLLIAGRFQVAGKELIGTWPLRRELLEKLQ